MHKEYILLNGFRKAKRGFTAGFHVPLTQHVLEPTRAARLLDIVLSSQKEFVDNVVIQEPLGGSDHNQLHFNIKIK